MSSDERGPQEPERTDAPQSRPRGGGRTRIAAVVGGVLVVAAAGAAVLAFSGTGDGDGQQGGAAYRLTTPKVVAGAYHRAGKGRVHRGDRIFTGTRKPGGKGGSGSGEGSGRGEKVPGMATKGIAGATYNSSAHSTLSLNGAYGKLSAPGRSVRWLMGRTARNLAQIGAEPKGPAKSLSPAGFSSGVLKCRQYEVRSTVKTSSLTNCAWGDSSTLGSVLVARLTPTKHDPAVPLDEAAELTAKVRADSRVRAD